MNELPGVSVDPDSVQINMVFASFDWPDLDGLTDWLKERGVIVRISGPVVRFVTHWDIEKADIDRFVSLLQEYRSR